MIVSGMMLLFVGIILKLFWWWIDLRFISKLMDFFIGLILIKRLGIFGYGDILWDIIVKL